VDAFCIRIVSSLGQENAMFVFMSSTKGTLILLFLVVAPRTANRFRQALILVGLRTSELRLSLF